ncbi:hypothetical protein CCHR01_14658 [Colletotrichum chrysophilum]|uniref:Uncharacterized protein n=1 Tax=Colletotrichum chrysophilum TaxID=1836956 RepID=A0AAD9A947_9PEZI|nr:hypothetical protein CCHR01_14658 [Colletotrichum chrysophilum]
MKLAESWKLGTCFSATLPLRVSPSPTRPSRPLIDLQIRCSAEQHAPRPAAAASQPRRLDPDMLYSQSGFHFITAVQSPRLLMFRDPSSPPRQPGLAPPRGVRTSPSQRPWPIAKAPAATCFVLRETGVPSSRAALSFFSS